MFKGGLCTSHFSLFILNHFFFFPIKKKEDYVLQEFLWTHLLHSEEEVIVSSKCFILT